MVSSLMSASYYSLSLMREDCFNQHRQKSSSSLIRYIGQHQPRAMVAGPSVPPIHCGIQHMGCIVSATVLGGLHHRCRICYLLQRQRPVLEAPLDEHVDVFDWVDIGHRSRLPMNAYKFISTTIDTLSR